jgi:histidine triad (HIT) family protein
MADECIFCRIIQRQLPAYIIHEDADIIVFLSLTSYPLIVPRKHIRDIYELDDETGAKIMQAAIRISRVVKSSLQTEGITLRQNNEAAGGQDVFHFHLHIVPRWQHIALHDQITRTDVTNEEKQNTLEKIRGAL